MQKTVIKIGPADHGKRMSLKDFDHAEVQEGSLYELSRGVITVSDVPNRHHWLRLLLCAVNSAPTTWLTLDKFIPLPPAASAKFY